MSTTTNFRTTRMVQMALLIAIIILMAFTPLGYIRTLGLQITFIVIPVTVGAIILGPTMGAILGAVFGITSLIQCFGLDPVATAIFNYNPVGTTILNLIPRILMGWLTGLIFQTVRKVEIKTLKHKSPLLSYGISSLAGPILNTILYMTTFVLIFYKSSFYQDIVAFTGGKNVFSVVILYVGLNAVLEAAVCFVAGTAIVKALEKTLNKMEARVATKKY